MTLAGFPDRLDRHLARRYFQLFGLLWLALTALYGIIDFSDRSGGFHGDQLAYWATLYYVRHLPKVAVTLAPVAMAIAAGLTVSGLRRRSELLAIFAAGRSPLRMALPLLASSLALGLAVAVFDDRVAGAASVQAEIIQHERMGLWGGAGKYFFPKRWLRFGQTILHVGGGWQLDGLREISIFELDSHFSLSRRIEAEELRTRDGGWQLNGARVLTFRGGQPEWSSADRQAIELPPQVSALLAFTPGPPDALSRHQLREEIATRASLGLDVRELWFEYHRRLPEVLTGGVATWLALLLALRFNRVGHLNTSLIEGVVISGSLWAMVAVAKALAFGGHFPYALSAALPELVAGSVALVAMVGGARLSGGWSTTSAGKPSAPSLAAR